MIEAITALFVLAATLCIIAATVLIFYMTIDLIMEDYEPGERPFWMRWR